MDELTNPWSPGEEKIIIIPLVLASVKMWENVSGFQEIMVQKEYEVRFDLAGH